MPPSNVLEVLMSWEETARERASAVVLPSRGMILAVDESGAFAQDSGRLSFFVMVHLRQRKTLYKSKQAAPRVELEPAPSLAWVGPLSAHPAKDLQPLPLYDAGGAKSPGLVNCEELLLGTARFLPDGSLFVVPGFQPGAHLFSATGRLLRTWDTTALGLDALDCAHLSAADHVRFGRSPQARFDYLNQHRVLEEVLPLKEGPGLLIRSVKDGKVTWDLTVLQSGERVLSYAVPIAGELPYDRLRGDVRRNRIVLLRAAHGFDKLAPPYRANRIVVAELPQDAGKGGAQ